MKKIEEYTLKGLKEIARELEIKGRSRMNKTELYNAIKTVKDAEELVSKVEAKEEKQEVVEKAADTKEKIVDAKKEAEIRIWADVLRNMPEGTPVTVKRVDRVLTELTRGNISNLYFSTEKGKLKIGNRDTEDGLPDAYVKTKCRGKTRTYQVENNDKVHFYMDEREFKKIKYGGNQDIKRHTNKFGKAVKKKNFL